MRWVKPIGPRLGLLAVGLGHIEDPRRRIDQPVQFVRAGRDQQRPVFGIEIGQRHNREQPVHRRAHRAPALVVVVRAAAFVARRADIGDEGAQALLSESNPMTISQMAKVSSKSAPGIISIRPISAFQVSFFHDCFPYNLKRLKKLIMNNNVRNRFIIAILHTASPKCLETKNPTNVGLNVVNYSSSSDKNNSSLSGVL